MLDLARIAEAIGSLAGGAGSGVASGNGENAATDIVRQLSGLGMDPGLLQGLAPQEIIDVLAQHGIDVGNLDAAGLSELASRLGAPDLAGGAGQVLADQAGQWLSDRLLRS